MGTSVKVAEHFPRQSHRTACWHCLESVNQAPRLEFGWQAPTPTTANCSQIFPEIFIFILSPFPPAASFTAV